MAKPIELKQTACQSWMTILLARAQKLGISGEVPVCAVILDSEGKCIGIGENKRHKSQDPLGHAELVALKQASSIKSEWRFNDCTLIVTLEPCQMCAGALIQARMGQVIFGAHDPKRGGLGGAVNLAQHPSAHHRMIIKGGIMEDEAKKQLQDWFKQHRRNFP